MISSETRKKWDERIAFLMKEDHMMDRNELGFVCNMAVSRIHDMDLSMQESTRLNNLYHKIERLVMS